LKIGLRHEDKSRWERRTALSPENVKQLREEHNIETIVQPSDTRIFSDQAYIEAGATVNPDLSQCPVILGLKEIPSSFFEPDKLYLFFSHTIKGQEHNMPMLQKMLDLDCSLIDYERIVNEKNQRLIFFGRYAGLAGMIDSFWALGQRLLKEGIKTPFTSIKQSYHYKTLEQAQDAVQAAGAEIAKHGLPASLAPLVTGITGYGHVSRGAQEIFDLMPHREIEPEELLEPGFLENKNTNLLYKVIFREKDLAEPKTTGKDFVLQDYYDHPEKYQSSFTRYLPYLTVMINAIYWNTRFPRLVTNTDLQQLYSTGNKNFRIAGDITCDIDGSVECTVRATQPDNPVYTYFPDEKIIKDGFFDRGLTILPVDNFPAELPKAASSDFSKVLMKFLPEIAKTDFTKGLDKLNLSHPLKTGLIVHRGRLTPEYEYLKKYL